MRPRSLKQGFVIRRSIGSGSRADRDCNLLSGLTKQKLKNLTQWVTLMGGALTDTIVRNLIQFVSYSYLARRLKFKVQ